MRPRLIIVVCFLCFLAGVLAASLLLPRYDITGSSEGLVRLDKWTGDVDWCRHDEKDGHIECRHAW